MRRIINVITFSLVVSIAAIGVCKDLTATLEDGRKVLLKEDGTWEFMSKQLTKKDVLSLESFIKVPIATDPMAGIYSDKVRLSLFVRNNTEKVIKGWKATMIVKNAFGDILFKTKLIAGQSKIESGEVEMADFSWEDNPFIPNEPYDHLVSYSDENLKIELSDIQVIQ